MSRPVVAARPPDGGWGWVITMASFCCHLLVFGMLTSSGVMFVGMLAVYHTSRAAAAWVTLITQGVTNLCAPIAGALGRRFSYRAVTMAGGIIACIGLALSFFSKTIEHVYVTYGVILGFGMGMVITPSVIIVGMYFDRRRALANGFCFAGSATGSFLMAPLVETLQETYGLRGTYLFLAGILLNITVFGALYRPLKASRTAKVSCLDERELFIVNGGATKGCMMGRSSAIDLERTSSFTDIPLDSVSLSHSQSEVSSVNENHHPRSSVPGSPQNIYRDNKPIVRKKSGVHFMNGSDEQLRKMSLLPEAMTFEDEAEAKKKCSLLNRLMGNANFSFFRSGFFWLITSGWCCLLFSFACFMLIIPDYAFTEGIDISRKDAALLISATAAGDLTGRLGYGWLADRRLFERRIGYMTTIMCSGVVLLIIPFAHSYPALIACCVFYGLSEGSCIIQHPVLMIDYLGMEVFRNAYGYLGAFAGILIIGMASSVGLIRDGLGSYKLNFVLIGCLNIVAGCFWFLEPYFIRRQMQKESLRSAIVTTQ